MRISASLPTEQAKAETERDADQPIARRPFANLNNRAPLPPIAPAQDQRLNILLVKMSSLGDVVQTIPVVHDILMHHPDAQIDWVVEEAFAPVVEQVQGIRRVIPIAQRRWRKMTDRAQKKLERQRFREALLQDAYDCVLDVQGLIKSAWVMWQARITPGGLRATYGNRSEECGYEWPSRFFANRLIPMPQRVHAVQRYRLLAAGALGYALEGPPVYQLKPSTLAEMPNAAQGSGPLARDREAARAVMFAHGTTRDDNRWPIDNWEIVGRKLIQQGHALWIPQAGAAEAVFAQELAQRLGPQATPLPPMGLPQLWRTMAACYGVIGVDSGVSHMAVALNLPHVQIFSQDRAWRAGPTGLAHQMPIGGAQAPSADQVLQAWEKVCAARP